MDIARGCFYVLTIANHFDSCCCPPSYLFEGEFPPRGKLAQYTRYPVVVPSSTPSYDAEYSTDYLKAQKVDEYFGNSTKALLEEIQDDITRGYCVEVLHYLQDATKVNPKQGYGSSRTAM